MNLHIFVQARMSSKRFPGKMLAPLAGKPIISHVVDRLAEGGMAGRIVVLTSNDPSDDLLTDYVERGCGVPVFRGDLGNVVKRFQDGIRRYPSDWIVRISGDSPLIDARLVEFMVCQICDASDLVSNVVKRTFPPGQSIECIRAASLVELSGKPLTEDDKEHVTPFFYSNARDYRIKSVVSSQDFSALRLVVDTPDDLNAMAARLAGGPVSLPDFARSSMVEP